MIKAPLFLRQSGRNEGSKASTAGSEETLTVKISMINADGSVNTAMPKSDLEAIKGQDIKLILEMGEYSWIIYGKDIKDIKDVNLEVKLDHKAVPERVLEIVAGGRPVRQMSLTFDGELGFRGYLKINLGLQHAGEYANLYFYDSNTDPTSISTDRIDDEGNALFEFSHASDYVIVIGEVVPATTDSNVGWWIVLLIAAVIGGIVEVGLILHGRKV